MAVAALHQLASLHGVQLSYIDAAGHTREAGVDALTAVLRVMGIDLPGAAAAEEVLAHHNEQARLLSPVLVAWDGQLPPISLAVDVAGANLRYHIALEDGDTRSGTLHLESNGRGSTAHIGEQLPLGYHELALELAGQREQALIVAAPTQACAPAGPRTWGTFLPLYSARSPRQQGIGDYTTLRELAGWTSTLGGSYFSTLPLLATFLDRPFEPSPYSPVSRLFFHDVFIDVQSARTYVPGLDGDAFPGDEWAAIERLNGADLVDYRAVAQIKRRALAQLARCFFQGGGEQLPSYQAFLTHQPRLRDYAAFRAVCDRQQTGWPVWPEPLRSGTLVPGDYDADDVHYHLFAQFIAHEQLSAVAAQAGAQLYLDLPLGVHPDGYDAWSERGLFAHGVSTGAPPDAFFTQGQNWGFAPLSPTALRAQGYAYLRQALGTHLRYARALRLDHVMALHRLFWVPAGMTAMEGVYVRYPADELYALLCLESRRHNALIVGEDLGTVPPEVRAAMSRHHVARMFVVQFEVQPHGAPPLPEPPAAAVACLNTHDMPTFEAFRRGLDADLRGELGLLDAHGIAAVHEERQTLLRALAEQLQRAGFLHEPAEPEQVRDALLAFLAASRAPMLLVNLEDLWNEERPQNVPGTSGERPNWRRRMRPSIQEMMNAPAIVGLLERLNEIRREN